VNDDELGDALRQALAPPPVRPDPWSGQKLRERARLRKETRRRRGNAMASVVVMVTLVGGFFGLLRPPSGQDGQDDQATGTGTGTGTATATTPAELRLGPGPLDQPLEIRPTVGGLTSPSCPAGGPPAGGLEVTASGRCVVLGPPLVLVGEVVDLDLDATDVGPGWQLVFQLRPVDAAVLHRWAAGDENRLVGLTVAGRPVGTVLSGTGLGVVVGSRDTVRANFNGRADAEAVVRQLRR
jgi:hypothetical protein